jgi:acyl-CoA synthetase (AMP-forming)/AMP-acid ligase II
MLKSVNIVIFIQNYVTYSEINDMNFVPTNFIHNLKLKNMKKLMILLAFAGFFMQTQAQKLMEKEVPTAVTAAFYKAHPTLKDVDWSRDKEYYVAKYEIEKADIWTYYDAAGKVLKAKMAIVAGALPAPIMEYVKKTYKEDEVKDAYKITDSEGVVTYEAKVKDMNLFFNSKGDFIKSVKD